MLIQWHARVLSTALQQHIVYTEVESCRLKSLIHAQGHDESSPGHCKAPPTSSPAIFMLFRIVLSNRKALEGWPQYSRHIIEDARGKYHVHLNVFEYFVFWTAFYVLRSSQVSGSYNPQAAPRGYGHLAPSFGSVKKVRIQSENWKFCHYQAGFTYLGAANCGASALLEAVISSVQSITYSTCMTSCLGTIRIVREL